MIVLGHFCIDVVFLTQQLFLLEAAKWDPRGSTGYRYNDEVYRFVCDVTGPLNGSGDAQGCRIENGRVITPDGFKDAWDKTWEAGWRTIASPSRWGGQDAPAMVGSFVEEMMCGANTSFTMYTGLTLSAAELLLEFGNA